MSRTARWTLGSFALLFAATFLVAGPYDTWRSVVGTSSATTFCVFIAAACFSRRSRQPTIRILGTVVFALTLWFLASELWAGAKGIPRKPREPNWQNATLALIVFGLPGLYVALRGEYPVWGIGSDGFRGKNTSPADSERSNDR